MQDLERKIQGKERLGKIVDVKFEKNRWYVKLNDGQDETPSGSGGKRGDTVKSDWLPWKSFSHGSIKSSVPPKKGQHALLRGVNGMMELGTVEPYHYGPENPSPHDKPDEVVHLVEDEEDQKSGQQGGSTGGAGGASGQSGQQGSNDKYSTWQRVAKNLHHLIIQKKGASMDGLGDLGGLAGMAGLNGLDMSNFTSAIGNLGNIGGLANMNLANIGDFSQLSSLINISNLSKFGDLGQLAQLQGLTHLTSVGNIVQSVQSVLAGGSLQAPGGDAGANGQGGAQKQQASRKIPQVEEQGHSDTTQVLADQEKIVKTVGDKKSFYRQDEDKVHLRYGEDGAKADVVMDKDQVKIQFKDKTAVIKWTENDLNVSFGEDKANIKLDGSAIALSQGKDKTKVTIQEDYVEVKGASECSCGVDGRWVHVVGGKVHLGVPSPKATATNRVMTDAGPSTVVWANIN
ncbi:hypothetical protein QA639_21640 [Bradyrhizobium pachyrhizi]|uniref:hypothetical protein n=1 Tax=Bradyrhizobium pachyrhizi TaxID=280333 RepID=UPI0024B1C255|nr:hypothetical protein [Bradyrhizobium pachyrhizi]WFU52312.1 hypothetical protein QA639_21640 [Bradyrhizobium pachyrhizi]